MIQRSDILSIPFLKKSVFTGSYQGMRYRLAKVKVEEEETEVLLVAIWEEPYCYDVSKEEKEEHQFPFSEAGICEAVDWLNAKWTEQEERWRRAQGRW